ncbi:hydroxypyruvate isomerase family protein [Sunxiuqinia sp. A32]|uniref:hydroxypyruvate isomerase family protein n=1 Tax=Sunxiuqinia sp. A32 TaxID=3461496 RepID=UPI00404597C5
MENSRRHFLKKAAITGSVMMSASSLASAATTSKTKKVSDASEPFKLKYAPMFNMFTEHAGKDPIDHIKFCHDMGFRAMLDNGLGRRPVAEQVKIINEINRLGMEMGPFVAIPSSLAPKTFIYKKPEIKELLVNEVKKAVEVYERTGVKWGLISIGDYDLKMHRDFQTANVIDNLRYCCDVVEKAGLILVMEPLNTYHDHPGRFLTGIPQAYAICRAVNRPVCKIIEDFYHQQINEGNLIPNLEAAWDEIAAFHTGDNPGRNEPTTGEINYKSIFKYLYSRNFQGVIGMEHGKSNKTKEGEARVIQAYRECDSFEI